MPAKKGASDSSIKKTKKANTASSKKTTKKTSPKNVKKNIKEVEKKMDKAMSGVAKKISPSAKKKTKQLLSTADEVANKVDDIVEHVDDIADNFLPHGTGSNAHFEAERSASISRLFIFRFLWMIIQYVVMGIWGTRIFILTIIHIVYMLVFGKRERNIRNRQVRFKNHVVKREAYMLGLTDERPDIITPATIK